MEEHRIPVYFVGGTSMGGLVGGMYSMGMTPAEIEKLVAGIDWDSALGRQISYQDLSYRRKQDRRDFQNSLEFGMRNGFRAPGGLNSGQEITFLLNRNVLPYSDLKSFDDLPIPFRCVAVELNTGEAHVFDHGPLAEALRATMSLPAIFTPVRQGDRVYSDGGLLDNLPVDVVKKMGADIVIGIHLDALPEAADQQSLFSVMGRSVSLVIAANELRSMQQADVLVAVDLKGFSSSEYKRGEEILKRGYEAAARKGPILSTFALTEDEWRRHIEQRQARKRLSVPVPLVVEVSGVNGELKRDWHRHCQPTQVSRSTFRSSRRIFSRSRESVDTPASATGCSQPNPRRR